MPVVHSNGARLNVAQFKQTGQGPARDLVLSHGLASSKGFWLTGYLEALSPFFRVTVFDQRGHGRSTATESGYRPDSLAKDIGAVIDQMGLEQPHILAHSFGGVAALRWAIDNPGRAASLTLLDSQISLGRALASKMGAMHDPSLIDAIAREGMEVDPHDPYVGFKILTALAQKRLCEGDCECSDERVKFLLAAMPEASAKRWVRLMMDTRAMEELARADNIMRDDLTGLTTPLHALYGEKSASLWTGAMLYQTVPGCSMTAYPDSGHFFAVTRAQDVIRDCLAFWPVDREAEYADRDTKVA